MHAVGALPSQFPMGESIGRAAPVKASTPGRRLLLFLGALHASPDDFIGDYYMWGNIMYLVAAVGYVAVDFSRGFLDQHTIAEDVGYSFLAATYFADAVLYWFSWQGAWPHPDSVAVAADYMNMLASFGYVCTSLLYPFEAGPHGAAVFAVVLGVEAALAALFVADALAYTWAWYSTAPPVPHRGCSLRDVDLWVNLLNVVPSILTLTASILGVWMHWTQTRAAQEQEGWRGSEPLPAASASDLSNATAAAVAAAAAAAAQAALGALPGPKAMTPRTKSIIKHMAQVNVVADLLFVIDALLNHASWYRDLRLERAPWGVEGRDLAPIYPLRGGAEEEGKGGLSAAAAVARREQRKRSRSQLSLLLQPLQQQQPPQPRDGEEAGGGLDWAAALIDASSGPLAAGLAKGSGAGGSINAAAASLSSSSSSALDDGRGGRRRGLPHPPEGGSSSSRRPSLAAPLLLHPPGGEEREDEGGGSDDEQAAALAAAGVTGARMPLQARRELMRRVSSVGALTAGGGSDDDGGGSTGAGPPRRLTRKASRSLAAAVVRRWTTAEGDPDFDAYAAGLFDFYGGELLGIEEEGGDDSGGGSPLRAARSFSEAPQAASVLRIAALAGGGDALLAPGDTWDIGYELLAPCKACRRRVCGGGGSATDGGEDATGTRLGSANGTGTASESD